MAGMRPGFVWLAGIRDLQWRRRRFVIAAIGTSLVFAITLLLAGFLARFEIEVDHTINMFDADGFVVQEGRSGPFTGTSPLPAEVANAIAATPGVTKANPVISARQVVNRPKDPDIYLVGAPPNSMGSPPPVKGRLFTAPHEAVVDTRLGAAVGEKLVIGGVDFTVVGTVSGQTVFAGLPIVFMSLSDAQEAVFGGAPVATAIAVRGQPAVAPAGLQFVDRAQAESDLRRPQAATVKSIGTFRSLAWLVAALIIGSVLYLSALERVGDFAVFKATGVGTGDLMVSLIVQAVIVSVGASVLSIGVAYLLSPQFPVAVSFSAKLQLTVPLVAFVIGIAASAMALRRAVAVDPALAFRGH